MKKKIISVVLVMALIFSVFSVSTLYASNDITGTWGALTWVLDAEGVLTISGEGDMEGDQFNKPSWHTYSSKVNKVVIEDGITNVGSNAFDSFEKLITVELPNSIKVIGESAFNECKGLISMDIPEGVEVIESYAFLCCWNLEKVTLPSTIKKLGTLAFDECNKLSEINLPEGLTELGGYTFTDCKSLKKITLPSTLKTVGYCDFDSCINLEEVVISEGVTNIGGYMFNGCISLKEIYIPSTVTNIGVNAFSKCDSLEKMVVSENNKVYDSRQQCNAIIKTSENMLDLGCSNTTIPNNIESIGDSAFANCKTLEEIIIPESVRYIGVWAFELCDNLKSVYFMGNEPTIQYSSFNNDTFNAYYLPGKEWSESTFNGDYGGTITWKLYSISNGVNTSDTSYELEYPIYNTENFTKYLKRWIQEAGYSEMYEEWLKDYTYEDLLNMSINVPVMGDDNQGYLIQGEVTVKEAMAYIIFADLSQHYIKDVIEEVNSDITEKDNSLYSDFLNRVKEFNYQYNNFQMELNGKDAFNQTLQNLILVNTAFVALDKLESGLDVKISYKYYTNFYKASIYKETTSYYDDLKYYILSGGDTKYLNPEYASTLKEYSQNIKNTQKIFKIIKSHTRSSDIIDLGIDNLSYYADKYDSKYAKEIKAAKNAWKTSNTCMDILSSISSASMYGVLSGAWSLSEEYINKVKGVYEDFSDNEAGWYALTYYYLGLENEGLLNAMIDAETGSAEFSIDRMVEYGFPVDEEDIIQKNLWYYYEDKAYLNYTYTPDESVRMYLWNACNTMINIQQMDCYEYRDMLLKYIIAELNYENGEAGIPFEVTLSTNDETLGKVIGAGEYISDTVVTLEAVPYENVVFNGWKDVTTGNIVSTECKYTFLINDNVDLIATFEGKEMQDALDPIIKTQPMGMTLPAGTNSQLLKIDAITTDGGVIYVDWYVNTKNSNEGGMYIGSGKEIYPDTSNRGEFYYYAIITNVKTTKVGLNTITTEAKIKSQTAKINIVEPILTSIKITTPPDKLTYFVDEQLVLDGMLVEGYYSDGSVQIISDYDVKCDLSKEGTTNVVVEYGSFKDYLLIEIVERPHDEVHTIIWSITKEATETSEGEMKGFCSECDYEAVVQIPYKGVSGSVSIEKVNDNEEYAVDSDTDDFIGQIELSTDEVNSIIAGEDLNIFVKIKDISDEVDIEQKKLIEENLGDNTLGMYLDISLFKKIGASEEAAIHKTIGKVNITFAIPEEYRNNNESVTRQYIIIKYHDGVVSIIEPVYNELEGTLSFETDEFSTYAFAYKDLIEEISVDVEAGYNVNAILYLLVMLMSGVLIVSMIRIKEKNI